MSKQSTERLQHWLTSVLIRQGSLNEKLRLAGREFALGLDDAVVSTETIPAETRIEIYTTGYMLRLLECMEADLPALYAYLGEDLFVMFAKAYLLEQPSKSYSLFELSRGFADFLDRTRPRKEGMDAAADAAYDLPAELARVERARLEAMRSNGTEGAPHAEMCGTFTFFSGKDVLLQAHPCLQLLRLKMQISDFYRKLLHGERSEIPQAAETFMAVSRARYRLQMYELEAWQFQLLDALQKDTKALPMSSLLGQISTQSNIALPQLLAETSLWLPLAIESGFVTETAGT